MTDEPLELDDLLIHTRAGATVADTLDELADILYRVSPRTTARILRACAATLRDGEDA